MEYGNMVIIKLQIKATIFLNNCDKLITRFPKKKALIWAWSCSFAFVWHRFPSYMIK